MKQSASPLALERPAEGGGQASCLFLGRRPGRVRQRGGISP